MSDYFGTISLKDQINKTVYVPTIGSLQSSHTPSSVVKNTPVTLPELEDIYNRWIDEHDAKGSSDIGISLQELIRRNAHLVKIVTISEDDFFRYDIEKELAQHFPVIGKGTESIVYDVGTFMLKSNRSEGRMWEMDLNYQWKNTDIQAKSTPIIFSPSIGRNTDLDFIAQEKLTPVNPKDYLEEIRIRYFPDSNKETFGQRTEYGHPDFLTWEWGLNSEGAPKVMDWG